MCKRHFYLNRRTLIFYVRKLNCFYLTFRLDKSFFFLFFKCGQSFVDRLFFDHLRSIFLFQLHALIFLDKHCRWRHFVFFHSKLEIPIPSFFIPSLLRELLHEYIRILGPIFVPPLLRFIRFPVKRI